MFCCSSLLLLQTGVCNAGKLVLPFQCAGSGRVELLVPPPPMLPMPNFQTVAWKQRGFQEVLGQLLPQRSREFPECTEVFQLNIGQPQGYPVSRCFQTPGWVKITRTSTRTTHGPTGAQSLRNRPDFGAAWSHPRSKESGAQGTNQKLMCPLKAICIHLPFGCRGRRKPSNLCGATRI